MPHPISGISVKDAKVFEVFSHPIMNAMNRLLVHYLLGNPADRVTDLFEFVTEAFVEKNARSDFLRILYQPSTFLSPFHIISVMTASSLAHLFKSFFTYLGHSLSIIFRVCVKQRDYLNALKLHKIASVFIVNDSDYRFPLYGYLYTHEIYTKVGFWKELLIDYCTGFDPAYSLQYSCLENMEYHSKRIPSISESKV